MTARLLLVDDNVDLTELLQEILEDTGYEVRVAGNCAAALDEAKRGFDVALVDVALPDGPGTLLTEKLRELPPEAAVILVTGFAALDTAIAAVRAGAFDYLVKPVSTKELLLTVEQALRQVRLHAEKRELAQRAQRVEKLAAVGTMTAGLSHEIRNPLNGAVLQLLVLERRVRKLPEKQRAALLEPILLVRSEIRRLEQLMQEFLQFARPVELHPRPVDLREVIEAVVKLLGAEAERRRIRLRADLPRELPRVAGDPERLRQVVLNLALNALEALRDAGEVRIAAASTPAGITLAVDDSGPGIGPEAEGRLFEPFFTTKPGGSGLGLPIVQAIVELHCGRLAVEKSLLGGARFVVTLPQAREVH